MTKTITYEYPLNELVRVCLRIEHLFQQINMRHTRFLCLADAQDMRIQLHWLHTLLLLLDRPDLKPKLAKEFNRLLNLGQVLPHRADRPTIGEAETEQLKSLASGYLIRPGKIAERLRENEFLSSLRQVMVNPAGDSAADAPFYAYWLNKPVTDQREQFTCWMRELADIQAAVDLLLELVRTAGAFETQEAKRGFFIRALDANLPLQLLRIVLPEDAPFYPVMSAGKHRASLRFMSLDVSNGRSTQIEEDAPFELACCVV